MGARRPTLRALAARLAEKERRDAAGYNIAALVLEEAVATAACRMREAGYVDKLVDRVLSWDFAFHPPGMPGVLALRRGTHGCCLRQWADEFIEAVCAAKLAQIADAV